MQLERRVALFPDTTEILPSETGEGLAIGGCDVAALVARHGTPLYLYDRATLDAAVARYQNALDSCYPAPGGITYAGKAYLCLALAQWTQSHDLWIDCTGAGEIAIAAAAGVPRARIVVHGVNKSPADLEAAVASAGTIVVDNLLELDRLVALERAGISLPDLWLRLRPGVVVETYTYTQTGQSDSKFGMGAAELLRAAELCRQRSVPLCGLHFHLGSHFRDPAPIAAALQSAIDLLSALQAGEGWTLCIGGGWGVAYHENELPQPDVEAYVRFAAEALVQGCRRRGIALPPLQVEPGRSLVARAGVAVYQVGTVKTTAGRRWALLDGGLSDNPRPALYGARYSALPVHEPRRPAVGPYWLGGPYCESSDVLVGALPMPELQTGDLIAVPVSGAYQLSMSSNYNGACRPAVLWLDDGRAQLIQAREQPEDLLRRDRPLEGDVTPAPKKNAESGRPS